MHEINAAVAEPDASARLATAFRAALTALAEPGSIVRLPRLGGHDAETALSPAARSLLVLLSDHDARWRLAPRLADARTLEAIAFDTGSAPATSVASATFLVSDWRDAMELHLPHAPIGAPEYPDRSATLIIEAASLRGADGDGDRVAGSAAHEHAASLSGPGLAATRQVAVGGVDARFWPWVASNAARFPLGVDVYLCVEDAVMGLPRSVHAVETPTAERG